MSYAQNRCAICAEMRVRRGELVCRTCREQYGLTMPFAQWPQWAKMLAQDWRTEQRRDVRMEREVTLSQDE